MTLPFKIPRPIIFSRDQEARYRATQNRQFLPLLQAVIAFYFALQPVYITWDYLFAGDVFMRVLYIRALQTALFGGFLLLTVQRWAEQRVVLLATAVIISMVFSLSTILSMVENGFAFAMSGLLIPFVIIPLMPSFMWAVVNAFAAGTLTNIFMTFDNVPSLVRINANYFIWTFVFLSILLSILYVYRSRRLFLLEMNLEHIATTDELSGLSNRRHFMSKSLEVLRAHRYHRPLSLLLMDVDHFKNINDTFGHHAGDQVIREIGNICKNKMREMDFVARLVLETHSSGMQNSGQEEELGPEPIIARLGGEEFAILLPETDLDGAVVAAERLRARMEKHKLRVDASKNIHFTVSIGVASLRSGDISDTIENLLRRADDALYKAKSEGRNRVIVASNEKLSS